MHENLDRSSIVMSNTHSISILIQQLHDEESEAVRQIVDNFIHRLVCEARRRLLNLPRRAADEEDVAMEAFEAFFDGVKKGRFAKLENRHDLWSILAMLAERRAIAVMRSETAAKRGGNSNRGESVFENASATGSIGMGINDVEGPSTAMVDGFTLGARELLEQLPEQTMRAIAIQRLGGYTNQEIAESLQISKRAVERKLQLIRKAWSARES